MYFHTVAYNVLWLITAVTTSVINFFYYLSDKVVTFYVGSHC